MSLEQLSQTELREMSLIELAHQFLEEKKQAFSFAELLDELSSLLDANKEDIQSRMVQFYTDINIDGRFLNLGENRWGLRIWYPFDQVDEEVTAAPKPKKKKKAVEEDTEDLELIDEDLDYEDLDDFEEEDLTEEDDDDDEEDGDDFDDIDDDDSDEESFDDDEELIGEDEYDLDDEDNDLEDDEDPEDEEEEKE